MNILVAIDHSDSSHKAVMKAITHCQGRESNCRITLLHVVPLANSQANNMPRISPDAIALQKQAEALLQEAGDKLWAVGIEFDTFMVTGDPADEILELADAADYDLIIMSSREVQPTSEKQPDRVSQRVQHRAACPVLVA